VAKRESASTAAHPLGTTELIAAIIGRQSGGSVVCNATIISAHESSSAAARWNSRYACARSAGVRALERLLGAAARAACMRTRPMATTSVPLAIMLDQVPGGTGSKARRVALPLRRHCAG